MSYSLQILKIVKRQFYMYRYFSRMHKEKGSGRALGLDLFIGLSFLLAFYFRILILYTNSFNPRINKDIIIICNIIYNNKSTPTTNDRPSSKFIKRLGLNEGPSKTRKGALLWKFEVSAGVLIQIVFKNDETRVFFSQIFFVFYNKKIYKHIL